MALIKRAFSVVFLLFVLVSGAGPAAAQIQGDFPQVVLFATNSMDVGASAQVFSGDVVVNYAPTSAPTGAGTLLFGNKAKTPAGWEVKANSIVTGNNVTLAGTEYCNVGLVSCEPGGLSTPVYTLLPAFKVAVPGGTNVTVPGGGSVTVTGDALDITVGANGTLIFTPGVHNVRSITAENKTNISFSGPTEVLVQNSVTMGLEGNVNKLAGASANSVVFYVGGGASLGSKSDVNANFYVPNGTLNVPGNVLASGAFLAKDLVIGSKAQFNLATFFDDLTPVANDDAYSTGEDTPLAEATAGALGAGVLANDTDAESDPLVAVLLTDVSNGTLTLDSDGSFTYNPDPDYFGFDSFTYQACDEMPQNIDNCDQAEVTITVVSINDPPVATNDSVTTAEETPVTIDVLANDTGGPANENQAKTLDSVSQAASGSVAIVTGGVTYTPNPNFFGEDTFPYTVCDGGDDNNTTTDADDLCGTGSVTVTVTPVNDPPTANPQDLFATATVTITLTGSDPDGDSLTFSVVLGPTTGSLGPITPVPPPPPQPDRGGGPGTPGPVVSATVEYTPAGCTGVPLECPEDSFTFEASDGFLADSAVVTINPGGDPTPDPGPGATVVEADDLELDTAIDKVSTPTLSAAAPDSVASLIFRVETLPTGALQDSNGAAVVAGADLPSPVLTYQAPATAGSDSFTFSARDSSTSAPPCGSPSCDIGTVSVDVGTRPELAPSQTVGTNLNTPVEVTLSVNEGGTGDGGGGGGGMAPISSAASQVTYDDNGPPLSKYQWSRLAARDRGRSRSDHRAAISGSPATLTAVGVGSGWVQFGWCDTATSPGCNDLVDLVNEVEVIESPFDFSINVASCLRITDALAKGDHFRVEASVGGNQDWTDFTSEVPQSTVGTTSDPDVAFGDLSYSHGAFDLTAGTYSVRLVAIPPDTFAFGTAAYLRVDAGSCVDIVWTVTALPPASEGTLTNLDGSPVLMGATYNATPTVVFTPAFNFSGSSSFTYNVTQGGTLGQNVVVDSAIVDLLISSNDPCVLVGRPAGCSPSGGGSLGPVGSPEPSASAPATGYTLTVTVEGSGDVSSSRRWIKGEPYRGLLCGGGACGADFEEGATVALYARPIEAGSEFVEWGGDCSGADPVAVIRVGKGTHCTATFRKSSD